MMQMFKLFLKLSLFINYFFCILDYFVSKNTIIKVNYSLHIVTYSFTYKMST